MNVLSKLFSGRQEWKPVLNGALLEMILSTNNCTPNCGCDDDYEEMTPERVQEWIEDTGLSAAHEALGQLDEILMLPFLPSKRLSRDYSFDNQEDARSWLEKWREVLRQAIVLADAAQQSHN